MNNSTEKQALKNIFEDTSVKTIYGQITAKINSRRFEIVDDIGRTLIVGAERDWSLGVYVIVQNNMIIGTGKRAGTYKVYSV